MSRSPKPTYLFAGPCNGGNEALMIVTNEMQRADPHGQTPRVPQGSRKNSWLSARGGIWRAQ